MSILARRNPTHGWNSWDSYGTTINNEPNSKPTRMLAEHLKSTGWQYVVVDMEWFVTNPVPEGNSKTSQFSLDEHGRYTPAVNRFPPRPMAQDSSTRRLRAFARPQVRYPQSCAAFRNRQ